MDFTNRTAQPAGTVPGAANPISKKSHGSDGGKWYRVIVVALIAIVVILIVGVIVLISTAGNDTNDKEGSYVLGNKLQAVFLNTGQVYFGNIQTLNDKYFVLDNIYYLQTSSGSTASTSASTSSNVSLVKLGCELHRPYDQMVINRDEVTFWENLESTGQVAKAVAAFQQQNPTGQKCSDQSSAASTTSGTTTQNAGTSSTAGTTKSTTGQ